MEEITGKTCIHGVDPARDGCFQCVALSREASFAHAIFEETKDVRFGGREPLPLWNEWAREALRLGFDVWWAVEWIRRGYPVPPGHLKGNRPLAEERCEHPRQLIYGGDYVLPCADPRCPAAGRVSAGWPRWRTARPPEVVRFWQEPPDPTVAPFTTDEWERAEWRGPGGRQFFWVKVS